MRLVFVITGVLVLRAVVRFVSVHGSRKNWPRRYGFQFFRDLALARGISYAALYRLAHFLLVLLRTYKGKLYNLSSSRRLFLHDTYIPPHHARTCIFSPIIHRYLCSMCNKYKYYSEGSRYRYTCKTWTYLCSVLATCIFYLVETFCVDVRTPLPPAGSEAGSAAKEFIKFLARESPARVFNTFRRKDLFVEVRKCGCSVLVFCMYGFCSETKRSDEFTLCQLRWPLFSHCWLAKRARVFLQLQ